MLQSSHVALVISDLHISDNYSGRHIDYFRDCTEFLTDVTRKIEENDVTHLFLTGDLIGRSKEKNLKSRDSLLYFLKVLQVWNVLTNNHVYSVRGNHDYGQNLTDFEFFESLGLIKVQPYEDIDSLRVHMVNYGEHTRDIEVDESKYNVAIMHTELHVEGVTNWFFKSHEGVELSSLSNLSGVSLVIGGHIHTPSIRNAVTSIDGKSVTLFYPGNGTRPTYASNIWEKCYGVLISTTDEDVSIGQVDFNLRPANEIFQKTFDDAEDDEVLSSDSKFNIDELADILKQLETYNIIGESDYKSKIIQLGSIDKEAIDLAMTYIEKIEGDVK